jgi:hypothetical protein
MSKDSVLMACNWAMALAGIIVVVLSVTPMFSSLPPSSRWVPAPAVPELSGPVVSDLPKPAIQQSRAQSIPANIGAAPVVVKQADEATKQSQMTQPNQPSTPSQQTQQAPQASQPPSGRKEMHHAVPQPLPPNVIPMSKYRPDLGDF